MLNRQTATTDSIHQLFDAVDAISVQGYDEQRRIIYWNTGSELIYGYTAEEALGRKLEELIVPEDMREDCIAAHSDWFERGIEIPAAELLLCHKNGQLVSVFSSHVMLCGKNNKKEMYCIDIDLADVKKAQAQTVLKESLLKSVFEATPDLFFLLKEDGTVLDYHASDNEDLYVPASIFFGKIITEVLPENVAKAFQTHIDMSIEQGGVSSFEYELNMPSGLRHFEARVSYLHAHKQVMVIVRDITEQHKSAELIRQQAYYDSLTSLPNRFLSLDRLSQMIKEMERSGEKSAVLFLDIDDFKKVNDSLGHEAGDKLLIESANRLKLAVRKADTVGRLGGDEFIVLLQSLTDSYDAIDVAESLLKSFREPFKIDEGELILTLSIGVAIYPENGDCASDLLRNADIAMYQAKASGRNGYSFFTKEMNNIFLRRLAIEKQLHGALERNEFEVYYQPKLDIRDGRVIGSEALLRWHNVELGNVSPDEFIPVAEHTGLIIPIGDYVIKQALNFLREWQNSHQKKYTMAINLSPRQFKDEGLIRSIKESLSQSNISPACLEFEITEGVLMLDESYINAVLEEFHNLGIKLSMDDFGTGYSSLSYLRQYAFDLLKIDRSFVKGITSKKEDRDLVIATIAMAHSLGLLVVAEGVETHEQLNLLDELGCDIAQGYYFSKPVPAKALIKF